MIRLICIRDPLSELRVLWVSLYWSEWDFLPEALTELGSFVSGSDLSEALTSGSFVVESELGSQIKIKIEPLLVLVPHVACPFMRLFWLPEMWISYLDRHLSTWLCQGLTDPCFMVQIGALTALLLCLTKPHSLLPTSPYRPWSLCGSPRGPFLIWGPWRWVLKAWQLAPG